MWAGKASVTAGLLPCAIVFLFALVGLLYFLVKRGAKDTNTSVSAIINKNTEDLQHEIDATSGKGPALQPGYTATGD